MVCYKYRHYNADQDERMEHLSNELFRYINNNNLPTRITAREATEQKLNILSEWPYTCKVSNFTRRTYTKTIFFYIVTVCIASFPGLPRLQFLIACSVSQKAW